MRHGQRYERNSFFLCALSPIVHTSKIMFHSLYHLKVKYDYNKFKFELNEPILCSDGNKFYDKKLW